MSVYMKLYNNILTLHLLLDILLLDMSIEKLLFEKTHLPCSTHLSKLFRITSFRQWQMEEFLCIKSNR